VVEECFDLYIKIETPTRINKMAIIMLEETFFILNDLRTIRLI
jgi:hypothetical protein